MDLDFALILTIAVLVAGAIWGFDLLLLKPKRKVRAKAAVAAVVLQMQVEGKAAIAEPTDLTEEEVEQKKQVEEEQAAAINAVRDREMRESVLVEYAHSFFPVLFVVWVLRSFMFEPFTIPSGSMLPTLQVGDYILVNKFTYGLRLPVLGTEIVSVGKPQRGDVMVFKFPENPRINYIKRVVGIPGDRVRVQAGKVFINDVALSQVQEAFPDAGAWELYYREKNGSADHLIRHEDGRETGSPQGEWVVPAASYFMMGDNRDNSRDSRYWGFVPDRLIVGKASYIWMHKEPGLHLPVFGRDGKVH